MRNDPRQDPVDRAFLTRLVGAEPEAPGAGADAGWWLTAGMSLVVWTAFALLLTA